MIIEIFQNPEVLFIGIRVGTAEGILGVVALLCAVFFALSIHELGHAFVALKCGDPTAKMLGRVTLNPVKHMDFAGTLMFLVAGFGWAKPVPVNPLNLKRPKRDYVFVSVAGAVFNIVTAFLSFGVFGALMLISRNGEAFFADNRYWYLLYYLFVFFFLYLTIVSIGAALFNLLPIFPLDGFRVV